MSNWPNRSLESFRSRKLTWNWHENFLFLQCFKHDVLPVNLAKQSVGLLQLLWKSWTQCFAVSKNLRSCQSSFEEGKNYSVMAMICDTLDAMRTRYEECKTYRWYFQNQTKWYDQDLGQFSDVKVDKEDLWWRMLAPQMMFPEPGATRRVSLAR